MAAASMNDIKARMKSVTGTMQITKAMELVATSKLRRAKARVEAVRPFTETSLHAIQDVLCCPDAKDSPYLKAGKGDRTLYVVMAGDRGLAGGYNSNLFRLTAALCEKDKNRPLILPVGKKATEHYQRREADIFSEKYGEIAQMGVGDCIKLGEELCHGFLAGEFSRLVLVYTKFQSMISQVPVYETVLPFENDADAKSSPVLFEDADYAELLGMLIPTYVGGVLYSAVAEALASESGARRCAMNSANKNAEEMIDTLMLRYNRARQAVITQEITEIVSGVEAL